MCQRTGRRCAVAPRSAVPRSDMTPPRAITLRPRPKGRSAIFGHGHRHPCLYRRSECGGSWLINGEHKRSPDLSCKFCASGGDISGPKMAPIWTPSQGRGRVSRRAPLWSSNIPAGGIQHFGGRYGRKGLRPCHQIRRTAYFCGSYQLASPACSLAPSSSGVAVPLIAATDAPQVSFSRFGVPRDRIW